MEFISFGGLDQRSGDITIAHTDSRDLMNVDLHPVGQLHSRSGMTLKGNPSGGTNRIEGMGVLNTPTQRFLYCATDTKLFRTETATAWTFETAHDFTGYSTPTTGIISKVRFETARFISKSESDSPNYRGATMYICGEGMMPRMDWGLDGEEMPMGLYDADTPSAGYPAGASSGTDESDIPYDLRDWRTSTPTGFYLTGRESVEQMFAWGFPDDPSRVDYSEVGKPWNFLGADLTTMVSAVDVDGGWFYALADDGDEVVGVTTVLDRIIVFKRKKTMVYTGTPGSDTFRLQYTYPIGCTSHESVQKVGGDVYWWAEEGPVSLYGVQEFGDLQYSNLGVKVTDEINGITPARAEGITSINDKENFRVIFFVPSPDGGTTTGSALVYYYDSPQRWSRYDGEITKMATIIADDGLDQTGTVYYGGGEDGNIYYLLNGNSDNDEAIACHYCTPWMAMGDASIRKRLIYVDVMHGTNGAEKSKIEIGWDYTSLLTELTSLARVHGSTGLTWDNANWVESQADHPDPGWDVPIATWADDPDAGVWDETTALIKRFRAIGTGHLLRVKFTGSGGLEFGVDDAGDPLILNYPMHLVGWAPTFKLKGIR